MQTNELLVNEIEVRKEIEKALRKSEDKYSILVENSIQGGTGLGMHIVYNLVSQTLSGHIEHRNTPGKGMKFLIDIPL
jgi:signal transduction histidine kinase